MDQDNNEYKFAFEDIDTCKLIPDFEKILRKETDSKEILAVVEGVSNEKGIEESIIFNALEVAIASASQRHFHEDAEISVTIDTCLSLHYITSWIVAMKMILISILKL